MRSRLWLRLLVDVVIVAAGLELAVTGHEFWGSVIVGIALYVGAMTLAEQFG